MDSSAARSESASFLLHVEFSGLVLLEQLASGPLPGTHLLLPGSGVHPHNVSISVDEVAVNAVGNIDLYNKSGTAVKKVNRIAQLSKILGDPTIAVKREQDGTPSTPMNASVRLPLPKTDIEGHGSSVTLEFTRSDGGTITLDACATGKFSVVMPGSSLNIGGEVFPSSGQSMHLKIHHMPMHEGKCVPAPHHFGPHHSDDFYRLLKGNPVPPKVVLIGRETPCPPEGTLRIAGVDPAQCWSTSV